MENSEWPNSRSSIRHSLSAIYYLLIRKLHDSLHDAARVAVVACDVEDDGVAGLERVDDALELFERVDGHAVDAQHNVTFGQRARARVGDDAARVYVLDVEAAHADELALVGELRRQFLERDAEAQAVDFGLWLLLGRRRDR